MNEEELMHAIAEEPEIARKMADEAVARAIKRGISPEQAKEFYGYREPWEYEIPNKT